MANSMAGNFSKAFELVTKSNDALAGEAPLSAYEQSELLLFQNQCLEKDGKYDAALGHLEEIAGNVVDALSIRVKTAQLLLLTGKFPEAQEAWLKLVKEQSENYRFHSGLQAAHLGLDASLSKEMLSLKQLDMPCTVLTLTSEQQASLLALYRSGQFKSSKKIEIFLVGLGTEFRAMLDEHMRRCLREGVPALYHDVCTLVKQPDPSRPEALLLVKDPVDFAGHPVTSVVRDILSGFIWNLREKGSFDAAPAADAKPEPPTALLWAMFLEVHLLERSGELARALSLIDECVHHTPTAPDMQLKRGRLLKLCGDYSGAASAVDEGRALDLQDRYLNNKSTKYLLRADRIDDAVATISLFTKHEGDPQKYLADMQCSWFEVEAGDAHSRAKNWGQALKKYASVQEHFKDYVEDMFDFHGFCIRKTSLRAHAEAVAMQDDVFAHKFFQRAFRGAARVYLHLLDEPEDIDGLGHLSKEERKKEKARRKKKRDRDVKAQEASDKAVAEEAKWSGKAAPAQTKDTDPLGERLVTSVDGKSRNFAEDAQAWCALLAPRLASSEPDTLALYTEIQLRRGKVVPAVKALAAGWRKSANCPALHVALVRTAQRVSGLSSGGGAGSNLASKDSVKQAVTPALSALLGGLSLPAFVAEYVQQAQKGSGLVASLPHRVSACRCLLALHGCKIGGNSVGESKERAAAREEAGKVLDGEELWAERGISVANAIDAYKVCSLPRGAWSPSKVSPLTISSRPSLYPLSLSLSLSLPLSLVYCVGAARLNWQRRTERPSRPISVQPQGRLSLGPAAAHRRRRGRGGGG